MEISLKILKSKEKGPMCRGKATASQNSGDQGCRRRGARRGKRGPNRTCLWPCVGKWWTEAACRRGTEPTAVASGGGGAPVRERARGPAVQLWCEAKKVMGGLVWTMWGRSGASTHG
jgi:hypothetical protein